VAASTVDRKKIRQAVREQLTPERVARTWLAHHVREYLDTGNPVYAWDAIAEVLAHNLEFRPSIRAYLLKSARGITRLSRKPNRPRRGEIARAVVRRAT
jgi:hypothetical protein